MSLTAAAGGFVVGLLSLSVVQGQSDWGETDFHQVCAVEGGTMEITYLYKNPERINYQTTRVMKELRFIKEGHKAPVDLLTDSNFTNRLRNYFERYRWIVTINNMRKSESGIYKYKFEMNHPAEDYLDAFNLTVTDLQVEVVQLVGSVSVELKCQNSCPLHLVYVWFINGLIMTRETSSSVVVPFQSPGRFSCAVRGFSHIRSPSVYAPNTVVVSVSSSGEMMEGSSVTLTCSSDANPAASYTWYKREQPSRSSAYGAQLIFRTIQTSDSGGYFCKAENKLGVKWSGYTHIDVKCAPTLPAVTGGGRTENTTGGSGKYVAVGTAAALLTLVFISVFLWIHKKRSLKGPSEPENRPDSVGQRQRDAAPPEEQFNLHYASVHFTHDQPEPLEHNLRAGQARGNLKDEDVTEYSAIKLKSGALRNTNQDAREDPSELYSTVNKARGTQPRFLT